MVSLGLEPRLHINFPDFYKAYQLAAHCFLVFFFFFQKSIRQSLPNISPLQMYSAAEMLLLHKAAK